MNQKHGRGTPKSHGAKPPENAGGKAKGGGQDRKQKTVRILHIEGEDGARGVLKRLANQTIKMENALRVELKAKGSRISKDDELELDLWGAESLEKGLEILDNEDDFDLILLGFKTGGVGMIEQLKGAGKKDVLERIVVISGALGNLTEECMDAVGGRVVEKTANPQIVRGLFLWVADGWEVKAWTPNSIYAGLNSGGPGPRELKA